ncbi:MAG TPA: gliding motility-associated C-terminal domain-containing protein, partial [Parapedobacter sp.]|nr:gliding motility-associated C-terminal domain-containing protein [Parapedobacter sp.]
ASITWDAVDNADGYRIYIGTTSGGTDVGNGEEVTGRSYTPASDWEEGITYYVTVVPFNAAGNAAGCIETSFTVEEADVPLPEVPECTTIIRPIDGESISPLEPGITWLPVAGADGYRITIGTTADNGDLVDGVEVNGTVYRPTFEFAENTTYYISVTPFNTAGEATGCGQLRFTIVPDNSINRTKYGFSPNGDGINDYWSIDGIEQYPDNTVSIYNRWGDLVFQIEGYDNQSNIFRGEANKLNRLGAGVLPSGTYFFTIQYHDGQETKRVEGFVVLRR